jgi:hypothetical protein
MQIRPSGIISTNDMAAMAVGHERWGSAEQKKKKVKLRDGGRRFPPFLPMLEVAYLNVRSIRFHNLEGAEWLGPIPVGHPNHLIQSCFIPPSWNNAG